MTFYSTKFGGVKVTLKMDWGSCFDEDFKFKSVPLKRKQIFGQSIITMQFLSQNVVRLWNSLEKILLSNCSIQTNIQIGMISQIEKYEQLLLCFCQQYEERSHQPYIIQSRWIHSLYQPNIIHHQYLENVVKQSKSCNQRRC